MNKEQKQEAVEEISAQLSEAGAIFAVDYRGIGVEQAAKLRAKLAEADAVLRVVKNRLAKRAAEGAGTEELEPLLEGPTALTFVSGDAVTAAKAIADFAREHRVPSYKGGIMDGAALDPEQFMRIARLPGRDALHGQLVGMVASPISGVTRGLNQLLAGLASQLGQVQDQGLVSGEAEPAEDAEIEPAPGAAGESEDEADTTPAEPDAQAEDSAGNEAEAEDKPPEPDASADDSGGDEDDTNPAEPDASAEDSAAGNQED